MLERAKVQQIPLKVYRAIDRLTIAAPMAGIEPSDILVEVTGDGRLRLDGKVRAVLKDVKELLVDEWSSGAYYRDYLLPDSVDGSQATATYGNGVLVVTFPITTSTVAARLTLSSTGLAHGMSDNVTMH
ncbi:MAG: Hsp20/alpha crystallin family protein [Ktedonobacteraceae bacterium]